MAGRRGTNLKNDYWPKDLLLSILATLPAKSLLRFKCVSMHWRSLIINPYFIEQHLEKQQKKDYPQLVFASRASKPDMVLESMAIVDVEVGDEEGTKVRKGFRRSSSSICHLPCAHCFLSNSCDGILCFFGITSVFVYNPGTREFRTVKMQKKGFSPRINFCLEFKRQRIVYSSVNEVIAKKGMAKETNKRAYSDIFFAVRIFPKDFLVGFGRDQVTKECKIIRLFTPKEENDIHECEVFTLSSDAGASWKGLGEVAYFIRAAQLPVYLNGALHWILDIRHANPSEVIVSFDLHTEKFQAISHPSCYSEVSDRSKLKHMELLRLRSSLCLLEGKYYWPSRQLNIWIMNQSNGIWEKLFSINRGLTKNGIPLACPTAELKDGTFFVLRNWKNLQIFDPESQSDSEVLIQHEKYVDCYAYSESLVPLYGEPLVD
ncbi:PREDICTED: putative F-box protein At2g02030 [Theobroma cacao]|uniref:F-box protein At2g02030 n=1 Tax=Theobroma cacao TaxID=3641 RepID=A0AB32WG57_THECC|nr:PREDICTED: putative F-box protein At2g02030 [Theobroma cacao]